MPSSAQERPSVILQLAIPSPLRRLFDYLPPPDCADRDRDSWKPGLRLRVPFGRRQVIAVLAGTAETSELQQDQLKQAIELLDQEPLFPEALIRTLSWATTYYQYPPGEVFSAALPVKLRQGASIDPATVPVWKVTASPDAATDDLLTRAPRQRALLELLRNSGPLSAADCRQAGYPSPVINSLADKGLITPTATSTDPVDIRLPAATTSQQAQKPNPDQQHAIDTISKTLDAYACYLLDGITGSGKTEVYMQIIARVLEQGRQTLVLVPEIGLTPQSVAVFRARFDCTVVVLHSGLSDTERLAGWRLARNGQAGIVIGTRSAVFTPLARPGLLVVDEEHDSSFKQQDGFRYSARDLAVVRAREEAINIILGSATPALETLQNARHGRYSHLILSQRAGNARKPPISLLDITETESRDGFSLSLLDLMRSHLGAGNQVLVFINRRGFAPSLLCQDCGYEFECQHCDAQLTVHKSPPVLHCHHCDARQAIPRSCLNCGSKQLLTRGIGTEKSEQFLQEYFQQYPVLRIDSDSTRRKDALSNRLEQVQAGKPCILVGTQMLAKGHHFPQVTLVAVLDADSGLFSPDFRGQEHMIQLLFQVAGRAGRAENPGQVVVQTRHITHGSLQALVNNNYHQIADQLLEERQQSQMPPFSHLALLRAESPQASQAMTLLEAIYGLCSRLVAELRLAAVEVHRPLPAPMERRAGRFRAQLLLKASSRGALQQLLTAACPQIETMKSARTTRWSIDVDPADLT
ncbi:MAG: primosomal protein N' [Gammaproteobacteria bacterium]|nr:primosomal protein N' [Gammaproteobacteria bacterium]